MILKSPYSLPSREKLATNLKALIFHFRSLKTWFLFNINEALIYQL